MRDLSMHIIDVVQNSITAGATKISIMIDINSSEDKLTIVIEDNGKGMTPMEVSQLRNPFFTSRTTRKVGMGIPLFYHSAEQSGGGLSVESAVGEGTIVSAWFVNSHLDRPPIGDIATSIVLCVVSNPDMDFLFYYNHDEHNYLFDSVEIKQVLGDISLNQPQVIQMLIELVENNIS